jgi:RsmE family RNA methyltransferase
MTGAKPPASPFGFEIASLKTMNLVLMTPDDFLPCGSVRLAGRRLEHVHNVHRAKVGDMLKVGLLNGKMGQGAITAMEGQALEMDVCLDSEPPPKLPLTIAIALPRPKALNRVVAAATSLGAARLILFNAWRVEKSYWQSARLDEANLLHQRVLGLEQAKDTVLPELHLARFFAPFVQDVLPNLALQTQCLVAHPQAPAPCPAGIKGPCTLVLGPEGGFIPDELAALENIGFRPIGLGPRILRTETALAALVGRLFIS